MYKPVWSHKIILRTFNQLKIEILESVFEIKCDFMEFKTLFFMIYCVWVFSFFSWVLSATSDILLPFNKIRTYRKTKGANMASGNNVLMVKVLLINSCSELFLWNRTYSQTLVVVSWISKRGTFTLESVQDFLIKLDIKPLMHLLEISTFSLDNVIVRFTTIHTGQNWL